MRKSIVLSVVLLCFLGLSYFFLNNTFAQKYDVNLNLTSKNSLSIEDFQIGGIKLEQQINAVNKLYGKPKRIRDVKKGETKLYEYDGIKIEYNIIENKTVSIEIERKNLKTFRGISVGDKKGDLEYRYGKPHRFNGNILSYFKYVSKNYLDYTYAIDFFIQNEEITKIIIYFAMD